MVNRLILLILLSVFVQSGFAQDSIKKNYQLTWIAGVDYSGIANGFSHEYYNSTPSLVTMEGAGLFTSGVGIRLEIFHENRTHFMISGMLLSKGFSIISNVHLDNGEQIRKKTPYRERYFSFPFGAIYKIRPGVNDMYLKTEISVDIPTQRSAAFNNIGSSMTLGIGKSYLINEVLLLSIEPTIRFALHYYGDNIWIFPDQTTPYWPISAGIMICLSQ